MKHTYCNYIDENNIRCKNGGSIVGGHERFTKGYCPKHYSRLLRHGDLNYIERVRTGDRVSHPLYNTYCVMKYRCYNKNSKSYKNYGGRGIIIYDRWLGLDGFSNFLKDMGERPSPNHSIERDDVNGNYCKENCRWVTIHEQASNKRNNTKNVGVSYDKNRSRWITSLSVNNKVYQKRFKLEQDAIVYRKELESKYIKNELIAQE